MNNSKYNDPVILNKINDFVRKSFDEVFSCSFIFQRMEMRISCGEIQSSINLQQKVMPQSGPLIFIPRVSFLDVVLSLWPDHDLVFHEPLTILL